jgi:hypothetical protein
MYLYLDVVPPLAGFRLYTVKKVIVSPVPSQDSITKLSLARNNLIISGQREFG